MEISAPMVIPGVLPVAPVSAKKIGEVVVPTANEPQTSSVYLGVVVAIPILLRSDITYKVLVSTIKPPARVEVAEEIVEVAAPTALDAISPITVNLLVGAALPMPTLPDSLTTN